jgi:hypothetical protein
MSEYFTNFPKIRYNNKGKDKEYVTVTDITKRIRIKQQVLGNILSYFPYRVENGERPDVLSYNVYGSVDYTWLILLMNDIIDPYYDWPLSNDEFDNFIKEKYGSILSARNTIHHYEMTIRSEQLDDINGIKYAEKRVIVDKDTFDSAPSYLSFEITNYDYEIIKNEKKRDILLIQPVYVESMLNEFRSLY